jgi:spore coat protein U-like protein
MKGVLQMNKKSVSLLALALAAVFAGSASAGEVSSTMTVSANIQAGCTVSPTSSISFAPIAGLDSVGDMNANSGSSFRVACSNGATVGIYSSSTREMAKGLDTIPFSLSLASDGTNSLSTSSESPTAFAGTQDGSAHDVVIYGHVANADFKGKPVGAYTTEITVAVVY